MCIVCSIADVYFGNKIVIYYLIVLLRGNGVCLEEVAACTYTVLASGQTG